MRHYGLIDALFLVRERREVNSFALCVVFKNEVYHYLLDMNTLGQLSIENGRKFENLLQVVDHYSRTPDGLLCSLGDVCPVEQFEGQGMMPTQVKVTHGPRRIEDKELVVHGELGEWALYMLSSSLYSCLLDYKYMYRCIYGDKYIYTIHIQYVYNM